MLLDAQSYFGESAALSSSPLYSTNAIDLSAVKDLGVGQPLHVLCEVSLLLAGADATVIVELVTESDTTLDGSSVVLQRLGVFPAVSAAGTRFIATIDPDHVNTAARYLGLKFTESGGTLTGGKIKGWIVDGVDAVKAYSAGSTFNP